MTNKVEARYYNRVQKIAPDGTATILGNDGSGSSLNIYYATNDNIYTTTTVPTNIVISYPAGLGINLSGAIYVCDNVNNMIQEINPDGSVTFVPGSNGINGPTGLTVADDGSIYVIDSENNQIQRIGMDGTLTVVAGDFKFTYV